MREEFLRRQEQKEGRKEYREDEKLRCQLDIAYFCNTYVKTYDPRLKNPFVAFKLFPKQEEFLSWLEERQTKEEPGLVEKSRDSGLTWLCCVAAVHNWLFKGPVSIGFGSRKLELVDKIGDPDSILEKCRIILRNLPEWMLPVGFDIAKNAGHCKILNPSTAATITGEGGDNIGRGGRKTWYVVDEAAYVEHPKKIDAALSATTNCRIDVSTPNGPGNPFYQKRFSGKVSVFTFHYKDDPRKGPDWYAKQVAMLDPVTVAQEIDIDYTASIAGIAIPAKWVQAAVELNLPTGKGPKIGGYDVADDAGANKNVLIARQGAVVFAVTDWGRLNTTQSAYRAKSEAIKFGLTQLRYDCVGVGAGVKGAFESMEPKPTFTIIPINAGSEPSDTVWKDDQTSKQKFINLRAEAWWVVRARFEKTFEYVTQQIQHPLDELISIPNHPELIAQLSQPLAFTTDTGKTKIESKDKMSARGVASPDFADALVMAFAPVDVTPIAAPPALPMSSTWNPSALTGSSYQ